MQLVAIRRGAAGPPALHERTLDRSQRQRISRCPRAETDLDPLLQIIFADRRSASPLRRGGRALLVRRPRRTSLAPTRRTVGAGGGPGGSRRGGRFLFYCLLRSRREGARHEGHNGLLQQNALAIGQPRPVGIDLTRLVNVTAVRRHDLQQPWAVESGRRARKLEPAEPGTDVCASPKANVLHAILGNCRSCGGLLVKLVQPSSSVRAGATG
mmetsp:Transcript_4942/g.12377  ORF Transcript_4942/g.12377 Transcript_4942/m.12377 type:complete len:212 (+) Transcript_4942:2420-3055(+)